MIASVRAAFRPDVDVCVVRAVARRREVSIADQSSWEQRMQKALVQMNIRLTEVLSEVMGATWQAIIRAIVPGQRDAIRVSSTTSSTVSAASPH